MDECDLAPEETPPRMLVDQLGSGCGELTQRYLQIRACESDVVHAGTAPGEEASDGRILAGRLEQLYAAVADKQRDGDHALLLERVAMLDGRAEEPLVRRDRLVEALHRDAEMMDATDAHASDASGGADAASPHGDWFAGVNRAPEGRAPFRSSRMHAIRP